MSFVRIETGFLREIGCGEDHARVICVFARLIQQLDLWTLGKIKPASTTAVSAAAKRRTECASLGPGLKRPSLR